MWTENDVIQWEPMGVRDSSGGAYQFGKSFSSDSLIHLLYTAQYGQCVTH